jgi:RluA family pseudouridine synthase
LPPLNPPVIKLSHPPSKGFWEIPVAFEDEHLLALNKPAGLLTSPDRYDPERPNLMKLLHAAIRDGKPWAQERQLGYLANAHRLDFDTSGVILLAKTKPVLVALANLFGSDKPRKTYVALVQNTPPEAAFTVDAPLAPFPGRPGLMRVDPKAGKKSRTEFEVRERFLGWTLLTCRPITGRTHQIRAHLRHAGLSIAGDRTYGGRPLMLSKIKEGFRLKPGTEERPLIATTALHAESLSLAHPVHGTVITIEAAWPKDLSVAVKYLRKYAPAVQVGI